jgi:formate hydrogenlyase transcriptional activator
MVRERRFRADLFYRLNVFPIALPPLRERPEDIPLLVQHFVRKFAFRMNKEVSDISREVMETFRHHNWPGNIRELQNIVERAVIMSSGPNLEIAFGEVKRIVKGDTPARTLTESQRDHTLDELRQSCGVVGGRKGPALRLSLARTTLLYRMYKLGIPASEPFELEKPPNRPNRVGTSLHTTRRPKILNAEETAIGELAGKDIRPRLAIHFDRS